MARSKKAATLCTTLQVTACTSTMQPCVTATRACPSLSWLVSNTATGRRVTGPRKAPTCLVFSAVIAGSFERIHRSNLVGMGVVPFTFKDGQSWESLAIKGDEQVTIRGFDSLQPRKDMVAEITYADGTTKDVPITCRIDTVDELDYVKNGGILHYVLRNLAKAA